MITEGPQPW